MVFTKYLDDTMVPEWKRAYIDYRGLKDIIKVILGAQVTSASNASPPSKPSLQPPGTWASASTTQVDSKALPELTSAAEALPPDPAHAQVHFSTSPASESKEEPILGTRPRMMPGLRVQTAAMVPTRTTSHHTPLTPGRSSTGTRRFGRGRMFSVSEAGPSYSQRTPTTPSRLANNIWKAGTTLYRAASRATTPAQTSAPPLAFSALLESLSPSQRQFIHKLDNELEKIESFYNLRESDARAYDGKLRQQTAVFSTHRDLYNAERRYGDRRGWLRVMGLVSRIFFACTPFMPHRHSTSPNVSIGVDSEAASEKPLDIKVVVERQVVVPAHSLVKYSLGDYNRAQRKLKRALREHHRMLEALNNYRILNLMGFRKALEKFDKAVKTPFQFHDPYIREKVEPCSFARGKDVRQMLKDAEEQFAACFFEGNSKAALANLRQRSARTANHFSVFVTGALLGFAFPAVASGVYQSFRPHVRADIPGWDALLFIYGVFLVPVLLSLLFGVNLLVWAHLRINYVFIFGLNPEHVQDYRKYLEIPTLLLATLCHAFWVSFSWPGSGRVSPQTWPIAWLVFALVTIFNPLPIQSRSSRIWLVRNMARLIKTGWTKVRFPDFWLSAQLASLSFTLGNIYFVACSYHVGFDHDPMEVCSHPSAWGVPVLFATLPLLVRFVQCIRRYQDSRHLTRHLVNAGKYAMGIVYYATYYWWRFDGAKYSTSFVLFCISGILYAAGSTAWEYIIDWSALKPHARYPFLRNNVLYPLPVYYFALVSNAVIRFAWIMYIPTSGPSFALRTWIVAMAEVFRRWQWNFFRMECEHIGNMDQYRITNTELPLFYAPDETGQRTT